VSDERHDEIAARLRSEAGARAPERLRADVMLRVRAEPRPRRIRPRRRQMWRPLGAVAAIACVLAALVVGLGHGVQGSGSQASGGATSAGAGAEHGAALGPPLSAAGQASDGAKAVRQPAPFTATGTPLGYGLSNTYSAEFQRANLPPRLSRALESLILDRGRGAH
jgi:negative regulator of sigma E activity